MKAAIKTNVNWKSGPYYKACLLHRINLALKSQAIVAISPTETIKSFILKISEQCQRIKELEMREMAKHLTQTLNYKWRVVFPIFIHSSPLFSHSSSKNQSLCPIYVLFSFGHSRLAKYYFHFSNQTYNHLNDREQFFKAIYTCYQSWLFIDLNAY